MRRPSLPLLLCASVAIACGGKSDVSTEESDSGTSDDGSGTEGAGESGDDAGVFEAEPAMGITITKVTTNQGTQVDIGADGNWVDGTDRRTLIVRDRDTLVQVHYTVAPDWIPREIEARLHLYFDDGTEQMLAHRLMVSEDSNENDFNRIFYFGLVAEEGQAVLGMQYQVELYETTEFTEPQTEGVWSTPVDGPNWIGFQPETMEMNVMFVPVTYNGVTPVLTEEDREFLVSHTLEHNPLQKVTAVFHDPIEYTQTIDSLGQLLPVMSSLRAQEGNQFTNIYYAALVPVNYPGGVAGIANLASANMTADRVNANVWYSTNNSDTVVHEIGHNQGLSHVACPGGNSAGNDPSYPVEDGLLGVFGFGIKKFTTHRASEFDYMTYCGPSWVSWWTWTKTYTRIQELTSWDVGGDVVPPVNPGNMLKGLVYEDGRTEWWTTPGETETDRLSSNHHVSFKIAGETVEQLATVSMLSDERTQMVETALPADLAEIERIEYSGVTTRAAFDPAKVRVSPTATRMVISAP